MTRIAAALLWTGCLPTEVERECTLHYETCEDGVSCYSCNTSPEWECDDGFTTHRQCSLEEHCWPTWPSICPSGDGGGGGGGYILCNDGTRSPSCTSCTSGCCSGHGGCE